MLADLAPHVEVHSNGFARTSFVTRGSPLLLPISAEDLAGAPRIPAHAPAATHSQDPTETDLHHFHAKAEFHTLQSGDITKVRVVRDCIHGKVLLVRWNKMGFEQTPLAAKKMPTCHVMQNVGKEANERKARWLDTHHPRSHQCPHQEDALTEIGVYSWLAQQSDCPPWILQMLVCFQDDVHTYLCTELADGGEVFDYVLERHGNLFPGDQITRYMWQLLQAVRYLHLHHIGHRDISLENILLKGGQFRLMDFGQAVSTHSAAGKPLRFFRPVGKANYRQPEAYLPAAQSVHVTAPLTAVPGSIVQASSDAFYEVRLPDDAVPGKLCHADVCGYEPMPGDVFACGVAFFILTWHLPPWKMALHSNASFKIISGEGLPGLSRVLTLWKQRQD